MEGENVDLTILLDELLLKVFDYLLIVDLMHASGVCKRWRTLGISHPAFWKSIKLQSAQDGAVKLFIARLDTAADRPVSVNISPLVRTAGHLPATLFAESSLYSGLGQHLHHIESLTIRHQTHEPDRILLALHRPAPMLKHLDISLTRSLPSSDWTVPVLPSDIFCGQVGPITTLHLTGVYLPYPVPEWFAGVTEFALLLPSRDPVRLPWLPALLPRLTRLGLAGDLTLSHPPNQATTFWKNLELLQFSIASASQRWKPWAQYTSSVSDLHMSGADDHVVDVFCDHLKGQLTLSLNGGANAFTVTLRSQASRFVRTIHEFRDNRGSVSDSHRVWDGHEPPPYRLFESQSMVHRVTMLTFAAAMWNDFMGYFPSLPVLVQLSIVSGPYESDFCMSDLRTDRRLRCPALRTISLHKHLRRVEETIVVSRFIAHGVERKPGPLTVCITSFQLEGPLELFAREIRVLVDGVVVREIEQPPESDSASCV